MLEFGLSLGLVSFVTVVFLRCLRFFNQSQGREG